MSLNVFSFNFLFIFLLIYDSILKYRKEGLDVRIKKLFKSFMIIFLVVFGIIVIAINSRYLWKVFGYSMCEEVENINIYSVFDDTVNQQIHISGNGDGADGYFAGFSYNIEQDTLYVGLKFNKYFGYGEKTKYFEIQVPCRVREIKHIYLVDGSNEIKIK